MDNIYQIQTKIIPCSFCKKKKRTKQGLQELHIHIVKYRIETNHGFYILECIRLSSEGYGDRAPDGVRVRHPTERALHHLGTLITTVPPPHHHFEALLLVYLAEHQFAWKHGHSYIVVKYVDRRVVDRRRRHLLADVLHRALNHHRRAPIPRRLEHDRHRRVIQHALRDHRDGRAVHPPPRDHRDVLATVQAAQEADVVAGRHVVHQAGIGRLLRVDVAGAGGEQVRRHALLVADGVAGTVRDVGGGHDRRPDRCRRPIWVLALDEGCDAAEMRRRHGRAGDDVEGRSRLSGENSRCRRRRANLELGWPCGEHVHAGPRDVRLQNPGVLEARPARGEEGHGRSRRRAEDRASEEDLRRGARRGLDVGHDS